MEIAQGRIVGYPYETRDVYAWLLPQGSAGRPSADGSTRATRCGRASSRTPLRAVLARLRGGPLVPLPHGWCRRSTCTGSGTRRTSTARQPPTRRSRRTTAPTTRTSLRPAPGITASTSPTAAASAPLDFDEDTAKRFREDVLDAVPAALPERRATWCPGAGERSSKPGPTAGGTSTAGRRLPRRGGCTCSQVAGSASSRRAAAARSTEYVSDPKKPVPHAPRPHWGYDYDNPAVIAAWRRWLVEDQRFVDGRPDVATWLSEPLTVPLTSAVRSPRTSSPRRRAPTPTGSSS